MNRCLPDWNFEVDVPVTSQKRSMGSDNELVELLWQNGQVVLNSQTHRKPSLNPNDSTQKHDQPSLRYSGSCANSSNLIQDEENVSWIQYPLEDPFEKEFYSNLFNELPPSDAKEVDKPTKEDKLVKFGASDATHVTANPHQPNIKHSIAPEFPRNSMPPPPGFLFPESAQQNHDLGGPVKVLNFSQLGSSSGQYGGKESDGLMQREVRECSVMTVGSSHCDSNQVPNDGVGTSGVSAGPVKGDFQKVIPQSENGKTETLEPTVTSSSGGSGNSFGRTCRQSTGVNSQKRKERDAEVSECQSEGAEIESAAGNKPAQRSVSSRRSRSTEVHNLSERKRRDRINEKMKALQELIPHCNKTDKASMLDEAIEYMKSLQLQLQVMWMGSGMAPVMFPGVPHYISRMGMGIGPPPAMPSIHNPLHLQNQPVMCQTPVLNPVVNYQDQMHGSGFYEQYARYMRLHHMQTASQPLNVFRFGSQAMQQSQTAAPPGTSGGHLNGGATTNDAAPVL